MLTGNECYTINIVCVIVYMFFVMGIDNECMECTKSIAINFFQINTACATVKVTKTV